MTLIKCKYDQGEAWPGAWLQRRAQEPEWVNVFGEFLRHFQYTDVFPQEQRAGWIPHLNIATMAYKLEIVSSDKIGTLNNSPLRQI